MTPLPRMPEDHGSYSDWDAAYVLGSLSPAERLEFETHLETCERCRASISELSALPGLLGRVSAAQAMALLDESASAPGPTPDLIARITSIDHRRRLRTRLIAAAAAALLVGAAALAVPIVVQNTQSPSISLELAATSQAPVTADVQLHKVGWGTKIDMACTYGETGNPAFAGARWDYALWVIDKSGNASQLSTWSATEGSTAKLQAGTSLTPDEIATVQIRDVDRGVVVAAASQR